MATRASSGTEVDTSGTVHNVTDVGTKRPYERMTEELQGMARLSQSMGGADEMAAMSADKMLEATDLEGILAAGESGSLNSADMVGKRFDLTEIDWAPSAEQFKAPFGVMGWFHYVDRTTGEEGIFASGAGNIVAAGRAMEKANLLPVENLTIKGRPTGNGTLYWLSK